MIFLLVLDSNASKSVVKFAWIFWRLCSDETRPALFVQPRFRPQDNSVFWLDRLVNPDKTGNFSLHSLPDKVLMTWVRVELHRQERDSACSCLFVVVKTKWLKVHFPLFPFLHISNISSPQPRWSGVWVIRGISVFLMIIYTHTLCVWPHHTRTP